MDIRTQEVFRRILLGLLLCSALLAVQGCEQVRNLSTAGLKAGINYMQPMKWRMTCYYRVQDITADLPYKKQIPSAFSPDVPAVGPGSYEVWLVAPREGEELFGLKEIYAKPTPNEIAMTPDEDVKLYYYNFSTDGNLPKDLSAAVQWEFVTFERYTYWEGLEIGEYDKESELYKKYTKEEKPITFNHPRLKKQAQASIHPDHKDDVIVTARNCYDYIQANYLFDANKDDEVISEGRVHLQDVWRSWENQSGFSEEYANSFVAMLRSLGIPARPATGICHPPDNLDENGNLMMEGMAHTWAEFYVPNAGWVPVDPAWGQRLGIVNPLFSPIGAARKINLSDYNFGKHDALRIPYNKGWHIELTPKPMTPGAEPVEPWTMGFIHRFDGVREMHHGWEGEPGTGGGG